MHTCERMLVQTPNTRSEHTNLGRLQTWVSNEFSKVFFEKLNSDRDFSNKVESYPDLLQIILLEQLLYLFFRIFMYWFIWLHWALVVVWILVPWPGTGTWPLALETPSTSHWPLGEVPLLSLRVGAKQKCNHWNSTQWIDRLERTRAWLREVGLELWGSHGCRFSEEDGLFFS